MNASSITARCDRAQVLVGQTQAYGEAMKEINAVVQRYPDPTTVIVLLALMDRLLEKAQAACAEASALRAITDAEVSARGALA